MNDCIGQLIIVEQTCEDSMAWARQVLPTVSDGTVLIARQLAQARGRQGRTWVLAQGQITHTIVLKPQNFIANEQALTTLNMALSLGLLQPLQPHNVTLKWPNDFYLNDKKLGGMLFENLWQEDKLTGIVLGYSLNINNSCANDDQLCDIATSLADAGGHEVDHELLQTELFASLSKFYALWKSGNYTEIFRLWRHAQGYLGKPIKVHSKDGSLLEGIAQDVLPSGDLVLAVPAADRTVVVSFAQVSDVRI
jgi:BirA family transcriptional regulator, biotin operon repressor / biotin---[acetyl-CoA-carboxylase] ligase